MGLLTVLGVELFRAIKNRNKDPELEYFKNKTLDINNKKEVLQFIDCLIRLKDKEGTKEQIGLYIKYNKEDDDIIKRIELLNKMKDE